MTPRGFLAWYLGTVAMVTASGAVMWHDLQSRKHTDRTAAVAPRVTPAPVTAVADAQPRSAEPNQAPSAKPVPQRSQLASTPLPIPPTPPTMQAGAHPTRVASSAPQSTTRTARARPMARAVPRVPSYQSPSYAGPPEIDSYPGYASGYAPAYPRAVMAPWQMQSYPGYYPYRRYYVRYPYYSAY
jgi:hypothetical protein